MKFRNLSLIALTFVAMTACNTSRSTKPSPRIALTLVAMTACNTHNDNPFLNEYNTPFGTVPFDRIKIEHYKPAFEAGIAEQKAEIEAIVNNSETPTFANTILAYDKSGETLAKVSSVFFNMLETDANNEMQSIAKELLPVLSAHGDDISMNPGLFRKIKYVYDHRAEMNLDNQQLRVVEKYYDDFKRSGAELNADDQDKLRKINSDLSTLIFNFGENQLAENSNFKLVIDNEADLKGLPQSSIDAAAITAAEKGEEGKWMFTLSKPSLIPFLQFAENAELRKQLYNGYVNRCNNGNEYDNKEIIKQIVELRLQKANLLGYSTAAEYIIAENMAKTPQAVDKFLSDLMVPAVKVAKKELAEMEEIRRAELGNEAGEFEPSDWWFYAEKVRKAKYDFDEDMLKPYLTLENVRNGMFMAANKLYGITFEKRTDIPVYYKDVETFEVKEADGSHLGVLYLDYFPRSSKSVGAWCTEFRTAGYDINGVKHDAHISLVMNFTPSTGDAPVMLNWDETETMWHEFGHSLHGFFSDGKYSRTCGNVPRDYVELPSQVMENWAKNAQVLRMYATHWQTGEIIPDSIINKLENSKLFNQGFETTEFLAAAILDMKYHELTSTEGLDINEFEKTEMEKAGLIPQIYPRYRSTYFSHVFNGGYCAGYYVYYWAAVLDQDAFSYFEQSGDLFNPELAASFRKNCLQECGNDDAMNQYIKFRGQEPDNAAFISHHGLN